MKKKGEFALVAVLLALSALVFTGCSMSKEELTKQVKASIEEEWESQGLDIEIKDLSLVKKGDKEYRGILEVEAYGESANLTVIVTVDDDIFMWEIEDF